MTDAKPHPQAYRDYLESRILSARPVEIVHLLYQVAIENLNAALDCIEKGDIFGRSRAITKAQSAVHELLSALDPSVSPVMARNLAELYDYVQRQIITGHTLRSQEALRNGLRVLTTLSEGWDGVRSIDMANAEAPQLPEAPQKSPETGISYLYLEPSRLPSTGRDWSC
jgi:flagellar protein FliS